LRYGALGLPLAFVALPLYVLLPSHYAERYGVPLAWLGALLLGARLIDAFADPFIGRWADRLFAQSAQRAWRVLALAALGLALGFHALFFAPVQSLAAVLVWCALTMTLSYLCFSTVSVVHQAWGARLGGDATTRARIVGWREAMALVGVLVASVLPALAGMGAATLAFGVLLLAGTLLLRQAPLPGAAPRDAGAARPWADAAFRRLLAVYLCNGIASAVPATLVLFFIRDRLQAPSYEPLFLAGYFAAGALSVPLWVRLVARHGLVRTWLGSMLLAIASFAWAAALGAGDVAGFLIVCLASGIALGADLTLPVALLTGVIQRAGAAQHGEGAYLGWWHFATKLNLALAAGLALPLLQAVGYTPGARDAQALNALVLAYCVLPCALKGVAALLLLRGWANEPESAR
jgi:Na+/melibiose symporter-like transporter